MAALANARASHLVVLLERIIVFFMTIYKLFVQDICMVYTIIV
jgi:hypothetical protein